MIKKYFLFPAWIIAVLMTAGCKDGGLNIFSIQDDIDLGKKVVQEIESDPNIQIVSQTQNLSAYAYLENIKNVIFSSGALNHRDDFEWKIKIIKDDQTLNAFCTPGGYIYVYTGLIKYLDNASSLAGVIGHEMAHADRRHSTDQLTQAYGVQTLLDIVLGENQGALTQVAQGLLSLSFSRSHEKEADDFSVKYLCPGRFDAAGAAQFFEKLINGGQSGGTPEFLSTHPNPENRVQNINAKKSELSCGDADNYPVSDEVNAYTTFKNSL